MEKENKSNTVEGRMHIEINDLKDKMEKLNAFRESDKFYEIDLKCSLLLNAQYDTMNGYVQLLEARLDIMNGKKPEMKKMDFSTALQLIKQGFVLIREGWNGKDIYVFSLIKERVIGDTGIGSEPIPLIAQDFVIGNSENVEYGARMVIYNKKSGKMDSWVPSSADLMAEDWVLVTDWKE